MLTHGAEAWSGNFQSEELKNRRSRELERSGKFDAFGEVQELPPRHESYDMVRVDEGRGDQVRSRLCVRQFKAAHSRDVIFAGKHRTICQIFLNSRAASANAGDSTSQTSVLHSCMLGQTKVCT